MRSSRFLPIVLLVLAMAGTGFVHPRIPVQSLTEQGDPFVPRPEVAKLTSFGFHAVMSDFYWLQAVQIVGSAVHPEAEGTLLGRFIDVITTVNPWVDHPYRFAAVWLTGTEEDVRHANRLLERSIQYHPEDWRNRFYLGFNHFYYLEDAETASRWLTEAAELPGAPSYLGPLAVRLQVEGAGLDVAASMIRKLMEGTEDPYAKADYEKKLDEIENERRARVLDKAREVYKRRFGRDITSVQDLASGPEPVMKRLPPEVNGWEWVLDEETGEIESSFYGIRYRPLNHGRGKAEQEEFRKRQAKIQAHKEAQLEKARNRTESEE